MRISDWSSDVCSSDLFPHPASQRQYPEWEARWESGPVPPLFRQNRNSLKKATPPRDRAPRSAVVRHGARRRACSACERDRKSVVEGKSVSGRVDLGGRRIIKNKQQSTRKLITQPS